MKNYKNCYRHVHQRKLPIFEIGAAVKLAAPRTYSLAIIFLENVSFLSFNRFSIVRLICKINSKLQ
jgi:hypothetical protein